MAAAVLAAAVACALLFWRGGGTEDLTAEIWIDGERTQTVSLSALRESQTRQITSNGHTLTLTLFADGAQITASDCGNQYCVQTGKITRAGQSIVCVPARVSVLLVGGGDGPDLVIG